MARTGTRRHVRLVPSTLLTVSRFITAPWLLVAWLERSWALSGGLYAALVLSDLLDGWVARRLDARTRWGGHIDAAADIFSVLLLLSALAAVGRCAWWTPLAPAATAAGFLAIRVGAGLAFDPIGKYYGAALFVATGVLLFSSSPAVNLGISSCVVLLSVGVLRSRWRHRRSSA